MNMRISRSISILIILMMILAMLPAGVFADDEAPAPEAPAAVEEEAEQEEAPAEEEEAEEEPEEESEEEEPEEEAEEEPEEEPEEESKEELSHTVVEDDDTTEVTVIEVTVVEDNDTTEVTVVEDDKSGEPAPAAADDEEESGSDYEEADYLFKGTAHKGADIRTAPDREAEVIVTLEDEVRVKVLDYAGEEWYEVILKDEDSTEGYIYKDDVTLDGEEELTEIDDYETPLGLAGMIEVTEDADSTEAAEEAEVEAEESEEE